MLKKRRTFFWVGTLLCLLLIGVGYGYYLYQKPHQSAGGETADLAIPADSLYSQYQNDEQHCDKKYLGKVLQVTGKLSEIQHAGQSEIWILSTLSPAGGGINCQLFPGAKLPDPRPKPGEVVTIKGRCTGFLMDVNLADCVVTK